MTPAIRPFNIIMLCEVLKAFLPQKKKKTEGMVVFVLSGFYQKKEKKGKLIFLSTVMVVNALISLRCGTNLPLISL